MKVALSVNGMTHEADVDLGTSLMDLLRGLGYASVKNGCDNGQVEREPE